MRLNERVSQAELAKMLNVSTQAVISWRFNGMPFSRTGRGRIVFDLDTARQWLDARKAVKSQDTFSKARTALTEYKANIAEHTKDEILSKRIKEEIFKVPDIYLEKMQGLNHILTESEIHKVLTGILQEALSRV